MYLSRLATAEAGFLGRGVFVVLEFLAGDFPNRSEDTKGLALCRVTDTDIAAFVARALSPSRVADLTDGWGIRSGGRWASWLGAEGSSAMVTLGLF